MLTVLLGNAALLGVINWISRVDSTDSTQMIHSPTNRTSLLYTLILDYSSLLQKPWNKIKLKNSSVEYFYADSAFYTKLDHFTHHSLWLKKTFFKISNCFSVEVKFIVVCNDKRILSLYLKLIFELTSPLNSYCNKQNETTCAVIASHVTSRDLHLHASETCAKNNSGRKAYYFRPLSTQRHTLFIQATNHTYSRRSSHHHS